MNMLFWPIPRLVRALASQTPTLHVKLVGLLDEYFTITVHCLFSNEPPDHQPAILSVFFCEKLQVKPMAMKAGMQTLQADQQTSKRSSQQMWNVPRIGLGRAKGGGVGVQGCFF